MSETILTTTKTSKQSIQSGLNLLSQLGSKWAFIIISLALLLLNLIQEDYTFYYDANGYWNLRNTFEVNGIFSFLNYDRLYPGFRAYFFPYINYCISQLAEWIKVPDYLL